MPGLLSSGRINKVNKVSGKKTVNCQNVQSIPERGRATLGVSSKVRSPHVPHTGRADCRNGNSKRVFFTFGNFQLSKIKAKVVSPCHQ